MNLDSYINALDSLEYIFIFSFVIVPGEYGPSSLMSLVSVISLAVSMLSRAIQES